MVQQLAFGNRGVVHGRAHGCASAAGVAAVVLETDGTFSVIERLDPADASALQDVRGLAGATEA